MIYRREIDGLRALAVVPVILFHAGFQTFSGGFVGVDVFFVISGYLITTIILSELEQGKFSIVDFYERRARRILPVLFFVMATCIPFAWVVLPPIDLGTFSKSIVAVSLFFSNVFFLRDGNYFDTAAELKPLLHTWSLSVEEQYYVLFPIFLVLTWRLGRHWVDRLILLIAVVSLAFAQMASVYQPIENFFMLPTRVWELAIGALVAFYCLDASRAEVRLGPRQVLGFLGIGLIACSVLVFQKDTPFPSFYALVPTTGAALIILFARQDTFPGKILGNPISLGIGFISYSAYLWHQPVFAFARYHFSEPSGETMAALTAGCFLLAVFSWKFIEQPFRKRTLFSRRFIFSFGALGSAFFVLFGLGSARLFDSPLIDGVESKIAAALTQSKAVFAPNMDEGKFIKYRIKYENLNPNVLVIGSSRIMQIGEKNYKDTVINLGVSGSSIGDDIAITDLATKKFEPTKILVAADPWLFNSHLPGIRWKSLRNDYGEAALSMGGRHVDSGATLKNDRGGMKDDGFLLLLGNKIFESVNRFKSAADSDAPESKAKIRRDGSRVYDIAYGKKSQVEIEQGFDQLFNYSMNPYSLSKDLKSEFEEFIAHYSGRYRVVLILSPYHPKMFERMKREKNIYLKIEADFRDFAQRVGVDIIGSYDPSKVGCRDEDFYDGMHPKDVCMGRVLSELNAMK